MRSGLQAGWVPRPLQRLDPVASPFRPAVPLSQGEEGGGSVGREAGSGPEVRAKPPMPTARPPMPDRLHAPADAPDPTFVRNDVIPWAHNPCDPHPGPRPSSPELGSLQKTEIQQESIQLSGLSWTPTPTLGGQPYSGSSPPP